MDEIQNKCVLYESKERSSKQKQIKFEIIDLDIYRGKGQNNIDLREVGHLKWLTQSSDWG